MKMEMQKVQVETIIMEGEENGRWMENREGEGV